MQTGVMKPNLERHKCQARSPGGVAGPGGVSAPPRPSGLSQTD